MTEHEWILARQYLQAWPQPVTINSSECYDLLHVMREIIGYIRDYQNDEKRLGELAALTGVSSDKLLQFFHNHEQSVRYP